MKCHECISSVKCSTHRFKMCPSSLEVPRKLHINISWHKPPTTCIVDKRNKTHQIDVNLCLEAPLIAYHAHLLSFFSFYMGRPLCHWATPGPLCLQLHITSIKSELISATKSESSGDLRWNEMSEDCSCHSHWWRLRGLFDPIKL